MQRCKKCKKGFLEYVEEYLGCEIETWGCDNQECYALFHVDIEIVRDFDEAEEVQQ